MWWFTVQRWWRGMSAKDQPQQQQQVINLWEPLPTQQTKDAFTFFSLIVASISAESIHRSTDDSALVPLELRQSDWQSSTQSRSERNCRFSFGVNFVSRKRLWSLVAWNDLHSLHLCSKHTIQTVSRCGENSNRIGSTLNLRATFASNSFLISICEKQIWKSEPHHRCSH